jgi:2-oxo-4-hydroxy-4-carboxy-5-ureidoimidazoline decarboxylase
MPPGGSAVVTVGSSVSPAEFVARFGGVYEQSPWVAEQAYADACGLNDPAEVAKVFAACVERTGTATKLALIRAHPDLAGRAAVRGELTADSSLEQSSAGIDQCTPEEFQRFQDCNERYRNKFGFPFVMAVRNRNRQEILTAFERRLGNDRDQEFTQAMSEIHKIASMRLASMFEDSATA